MFVVTFINPFHIVLEEYQSLRVRSFKKCKTLLWNQFWDFCPSLVASFLCNITDYVRRSWTFGYNIHLEPVCWVKIIKRIRILFFFSNCQGMIIPLIIKKNKLIEVNKNIAQSYHLHFVCVFAFLRLSAVSWVRNTVCNINV